MVSLSRQARRLFIVRSGFMPSQIRVLTHSSTSLRKLPNVAPMFTTGIVTPRKRGPRATCTVLAAL